jgi:phage tail tube protein FII|tara:strand:- start:5139 stop:5423 length:285 start_codon:yes stop_codon:yes gene_type:complete
MTLKTKLIRFSKKGYEVAFSKKSNADKYMALLKENGYRSGILRSSGPTIDGAYKRNAYYVVAEKAKRKKKATRKVKRKKKGRFTSVAKGHKHKI